MTNITAEESPFYCKEEDKTTSNEDLLKKIHSHTDHPSHYTSDPSGIECIQVTQYRDFCIGSAMKYLWRAGLKMDADKSKLEKEYEDLEKAKWFISKKQEMLLTKINDLK